MKRRRSNGGAPTRLSLATALVLIDELRWGAPLEAAARAAGVDPATARRWLVKGRAGLSPYREFSGIVDAIRQHQRAARAQSVPRGRARREQWIGSRTTRGVFG